MTPRYPILHHTLQLIKFVRPESVDYVVDVGAQRATPFLMDICKDSFHHLFEPVTTYHADLETNYRQARIKHKIHKVALSDTDGLAYLHNYSEDHSGSITHSYLNFDRESVHKAELISIEQVPQMTLDSVFKDEPLPKGDYIIKLDVDGVEEKIIAGAAHTAENAAFIIIEASLGRRNLISRLQLIESLGFRLFDICDHGYYFGQMSQCDLVFINEKIRLNTDKFRPWEKMNYKVTWQNWQHGFLDLEKRPFDDPYSPSLPPEWGKK